MVTNTVEGRERFSVNVRYPRGLRDDPQAIATQVLVNTSDGMAIPLGQVVSIQINQGPPSIRTENAQLVDYIYVDMQGRDLGGYVADAQRAVREQVKFSPGYHIEWSGQFEYLERAETRLQTVVSLTLFIIFLLLYLNFRRLTETLIVMLSVPFALTGGLWLMYLMGFNMSVAVAVGFIALAGVAAETGVVMLIYLDNAFTGGAQGAGATGHRSRSPRRHYRGRGRARAAEDDDRVGDHGGAATDPVEHRNRLRGDAADRRANGRRHDFINDTHADRHPRNLLTGEVAGNSRGTPRAPGASVQPGGVRSYAMMDHMMGGGMMWGMGLVGVLVIIVLLLAAAALVKYLFFGKSR